MDTWSLPYEFHFQDRIIKYGITGQGPALVAVHGTPWSSYNLRHLIKSLATNHTVYYYDLLGYGQSSKEQGDVSLGIQNEALSALLAYWKLNSPIVLGHDFGGTTVLRTHLLNNHPFKKIILIDPVAISPWGSPFFQHVHEHEAAFAGVPDYIHKAIVKAYIQTAAHLTIPEVTLNNTIAPWTGPKGKAAFYRQIAQASSHFTDEIEPLYKNISTPTLIIWGKEDTWIPVDKAHKLHKLIPTAELLLIDDAGHLVIEEHPQQILKNLASFLAN